MDGLRRTTILYLAFIVIFANAACSQELPGPKAASIADSSLADGGPVIGTPGAMANSYASAVLTEPNNANCWIGQSLAPGDICTYPGTSDEFRVDAEGKGHFLFFTATAVINAQNANINGRNYDFSARKKDDGNWHIELAGTSFNVIRVSDLIAPASSSSMSSTSGAESPVTGKEVLLSTPRPVVWGTPESASIFLSSIAETASYPEQVTNSEPLRYSPVEAPTSEMTPVSKLTSTKSADAVSVHATASKIPVQDLRENRSPLIVGYIGEQTVTVGESIVVDVARVFSDADGDTVEQYIVILSDTTVASGTTELSVGSLTLKGLQIGTSWVSVKACDHSDCSAPGDLTFQLIVKPPPNRPPQLVSYVDDQQVTVGKAKSISVRPAFRDFEGDRISGYKVKLQDEGLAKVTVNAANGVLRFKGLQIGSTTVSVRACDSEICGNEASGLRFGLEIAAPSNSPPIVLGSIDDQSVSVDEVIQLDTSYYFEDPDGDHIEEYQFSQSEHGIADVIIHPSKGILTIKGIAAGDTSISVDASDGNRRGETSSLTFNLEVIEQSPKLPLVVGVLPDRTVELGDSIKVPVTRAFNAPSRHPIIRYEFLVNDREVAADSSIAMNGVLTLVGSEVGRSRVSVRACSHLGCSNFSDLYFVLTVTGSKRPINRRPEVVGGVFNRSLGIGESFTMDVSSAFSDPDGEAIVDYSYIIGNPAVVDGSSITDAGVLMLRGSEPGTTTISVIACDDEGKCSDPDDMEFTLTVEASVDGN